MERLRLALGVSWTYVDAVSYDASVVSTIIDCVRLLRSTTRADTFEWPSNDDLSVGLTETRPVSPSFPCHPAVPVETGRQHPRVGSLGDSSAGHLTCATENRIGGVPLRPDLSTYMVLNAGKVACWYSHLAAIAQVVSYEDITSTSDSLPAFLILEDDIDMDQRLHEKLLAVWPALPTDWDVVFLGKLCSTLL
ncbi:hypothetical protein ONZ51_g3360 [Trametes cubensis]|uniref:Uncharacterized protein n=1 Tax=Trametes cubensis TaxID=1111947 RepID=A0AAD7TXV2_9APHY|nr:hypothetical protein ONZ51_g3360 [Trametes cubensis]